MAIYKENNKEKWTKDGRCWYYRVYYTDLYGNRKQKESKLFPTKKEAAESEAMFLLKTKTTDEVDYNVAFENVYNEWWFYKQKKVKVSTYYSIKSTLDKHVLSYFKPYKLHSIKNNVINTWYENLEKSGHSIKSQNRVIGYLRELFNYACDNYDFDIKVASKIIKKKDYSVDSKKISEWNFWTYEDFSKFIEKVDNDFDFLLFNFLYYTGTRIGECLGLKWDDIDFNKDIIKVTKEFNNKLGENTFKLIPPKTKNSIRNIDIDENLITLLKKKYDEDKNIIHFNKDMFVFGDVRPISPTTVTRHFKKYYDKYTEELNLKYITIHGFRHSHVSLLIHLGCDARDVASRIGDTVPIVEKTYYHMFPDKKNKTIATLNSFINSKK